jgi:ribosome biogenesis SPOUT family RNA methylase Rps3
LALAAYIFPPMATNPRPKTYVVEHLDPELGPWSELEYLAIAKECHEAGSKFSLSSLPAGFRIPEALAAVPSFEGEARGVEEIYADDRSRVCLLDPAAEADLRPGDGDVFDVFLFGGILGRQTLRLLRWGRLDPPWPPRLHC